MRFANEAHQLGGIPESVGRPWKAALALRRIAAQRQDVFDAALAQAVENRGDLVAAVADAGQVRHRFDAVLPLDASDEVDGLVTRAAARSVGDRDEARIERAQLLDRAQQRAFPLFGLRREELEGEYRSIGGEKVADQHERFVLWRNWRARATERSGRGACADSGRSS